MALFDMISQDLRRFARHLPAEYRCSVRARRAELMERYDIAHDEGDEITMDSIVTEAEFLYNDLCDKIPQVG